MRRVWEGDFEAYVAATQRLWLNRATRLCRDPELAQDLVQHCWEKLYLRWPKVVAEGDPGPWMTTTMHRKFLDHVRSHRFRREVIRNQPPEVGSQVSFADVHASGDSLAAAWSLLTEQERSVMDLRVFDGYAMPQIAQLTGMSLSTVNRRFATACNKLRHHYQSDAGLATGGLNGMS